jgi:hypothetical protein
LGTKVGETEDRVRPELGDVVEEWK